ncbi:MAG: tetratricopeptide repeat protein [Gemmataceae bacterium]
MREGKFLEARAVLDQAVSQPAPLGIADAYNLRGWIHAQRADFAAAIADYNQALKEDPKHVLALKNRAWAHDCLGQDEDAMRDYAAIMQLEPASAWAYKYRGELLARNGDTAKALADLDEVMRLEPDNPWPHWRTAELLQLTSQTEAALQAAGAAVELGQDDAAAYLARGRARQALGQFSAARADLTRARQLDPRHADIARELDLCRAWEQVARCTETLDSSSSPAAADLRARGQAYLTLGELDRARADFEAAREREPKNADAWIYLGNLNMKRKELEQARADYQRAIELAPENALARNNRGKALLEAGDVQGAIQDFERALALEAQLPEAHYNLGKLSYTTGANGQAVRQLSLALESRPGWVAALDLRGRAHLAEKRHDLALADFEACLNLQPERTAHWQHLLGLIQERKGNTGAAVQHHRQAVEIAPRKADYYHALGRAYLADGQYERGLTDLLRARWLGCKGADFLNDLAWAHHLNRDYAQAISIYDLALQLKPDDAWILYRRALASMRLGRHQDALANLDRAVQLRPDYAAAAQIRRVLSEEN